MPEGDTIYRAAGNLRRAVEKQQVVQAEARDPATLPAASLCRRRLAIVEARGKHLLLHFDDGRVLHSHMGMTGSWHLYAAGQPWQKPARRAAVWLTFANNAVTVCFSPKTLELLSPDAFRRHQGLRQLGPDVLSAALDEAEVLRRFRLHDAAAVGQAMLNQTILCGVGNVYKSEVLFLSGICPLLPVSAISEPALRELLAKTRRLMRRNLDGRPRRTRFRGDAQRAWVYGRQGQPCLQCGATIVMQRQGDLGRSTYWCPICQPC